jgi:anaerobic ribonucleoside-triphosphate reductase activating protein
MRYSGLILNDMAAAPGLCVTLFTQGCPHHCPKCHNPDSWSFDGGMEFTMDTLDTIIKGLTAQGIKRNLCIMGGEPLCLENAFLTYLVISKAKEAIPDLKVYVWTGYTLEQLELLKYPRVLDVLKLTDYLIDGPYIDALRDITLPMRGSSNQRIIDLSKKI